MSLRGIRNPVVTCHCYYLGLPASSRGRTTYDPCLVGCGLHARLLLLGVKVPKPHHPQNLFRDDCIFWRRKVFRCTDIWFGCVALSGRYAFRIRLPKP